MQIEVSILAHVNDVRKPLVYSVAFRLGIQGRRVQGHHFLITVAEGFYVEFAAEILPQVVARKNQRSSSVFFLTQSKQIGREANLGLNLFFAVTEIVVG